MVPILALFLSMEYSATASAEGCEFLEKLDVYGDTQIAPDDAICSTYLSQSSKIGVACFWEFPRLAPEAGLMADLLWTRLKNCRAGSQQKKDQSVNHPDSYSLRQWNAGSHIYRVAIKDKAELNQTLVFIRLEKQ